MASRWRWSGSPLFSRYMRSSAIDNLTQDYIRTARAKGVRADRGCSHARAAQLAAAGRHADRALPAGRRQRGADRRVRLQLPRHGPAVLARGADLGLPGAARAARVVVGVATVVGTLLADVLYSVARPEGTVCREPEFSCTWQANRVDTGPAESPLGRPVSKPRGVVGPGRQAQSMAPGRSRRSSAEQAGRRRGLIIVILLVAVLLRSARSSTTRTRCTRTSPGRPSARARAIRSAPTRRRVRRARPADGRRPDLARRSGCRPPRLATVLGTLWGAMSGFVGGAVDAVMMRHRRRAAGHPDPVPAAVPGHGRSSRPRPVLIVVHRG